MHYMKHTVKIVILWNIITIRIYTISQKFLNSKIFLLFCPPSLHLFDPKYSKISNIVK